MIVERRKGGQGKQTKIERTIVSQDSPMEIPITSHMVHEDEVKGYGTGWGDGVHSTRE